MTDELSEQSRRRNAEQKNGRRRERYRELRFVGCTVAEAQRLQDTYGAVEYARRKIAKGLRP